MAAIKFLLNEKMSDVVYHRTGVDNAINIINSDRFRLTLSIGTPAERDINKNKFFYLSTARSPTSSYVAQQPMVGQMYFTLDGRKFGQKYKGFPVDYWGPEYRKIAPTKHEMEDRVVSDKQYIENAKEYIKEVHVLVSNGEYDIEPKKLEKVKQLFSVSKKNKIPVYLHDTISSYLTGSKIKAIQKPLEWIKNFDTGGEKTRKYVSLKTGNPFAEWLELLNFPIEKYNVKGYTDYQERVKELLSLGADKLLFNYILHYYKDDAYRRLDNDIHNAKTNDKVGSLVNAMRKLKLNTAKEVVDYLENKWKVIKGN